MFNGNIIARQRNERTTSNVQEPYMTSYLPTLVAMAISRLLVNTDNISFSVSVMFWSFLVTV